jgi:diguanylate cyclase (GGDEF)-like protein/PAS domain S-box-containing protein
MQLKRRLFYSLPMILLLIVAVAGWFATVRLGNKARQEIIGESQSLSLTLEIYVSSTLTHVAGSVKSLAGSPWIAPALLSKAAQDIERANSALDRYNSALDASVSYLMDADGMTVASSNRNDLDSFLGKSYRFRPYFQVASKGQPGRYFALGVTSGKRGFYASYPVQDRSGKVVGVVTMKKDLDGMEVFFSKYPFCFLISPDGIIFLSSTTTMVLKSLWPLDKAVRETLLASQQFGNKLSDAAFLKKEIADGKYITLEGKDYFVSRKVIDREGWSIVLLTPTESILYYKWLGILVTIAVGLLIMVFSGIIYFTNRSKDAFRQSEESKRQLLHAVGDGIFGVDATGKLTFVNPAAMRMLGFSEEEMLGRDAHALIHYSHEDGSNYPVEDCPMYASYAKATENRVTEEVLWRKDGSYFPVDYSSTPIIKDSRVIGVVVNFKDITESKRMNEALKKREALLNEMGKIAKIGGWEFDAESQKQVWTKEVYRIHEVDESYEPTLGNGIEFYVPASRPVIERAVQRAIEVGEPFDVELEIITAKGNHRWVHAGGKVEWKSGRKIISGTFQDITERRQVDEKIRQMAYHDPLTGLPNRMLLIDRLTMAMSQADRNRNKVAFLMLDLDNFKEVNDALGHHIGDLLLKAVAEKMTSVLRHVDTVARFGGDEFVLVLSEQKDARAALQVARKIMEAFRDTVVLDGHSLTITSSIGISLYPDHGADIDTILKNADSAMYQAKQAGRNRYQLYKEA